MEKLITNRREFLYHMGKLGLAASALPLVGCSSEKSKTLPPSPGTPVSSTKNTLGIPFVQPTLKDDLVVAQGVTSRILLKEGQSIGKDLIFGSNNDYIMTVPYNSKRDALMWVNHEYPSITHLYGTNPKKRNAKSIALERKYVGGSIVRIKKKDTWTALIGDKANKRIDGTTKIKFSAGLEIAGSKVAEGTLANCAGGVTPWNTILTCEENAHSFYGTSPRDKHHKAGGGALGWDKLFNNPPEHYGWVVEVDPVVGSAKKLVSLGRFAHECATIATTKDGRAVAYTSDDRADECLYKFVASKPGTLEYGTLYVADIKKGKWVSLDRKAHKVLQNEYKTQLEVQMYTQRAAELVGGTPLDRPEDIEIDPETGAVIVALTNNKGKGRYFGSLLHLQEKGDRDSLEFEAKTLVSGGLEAGFACPDNLCFDDANNLWVATDISSPQLGKGKYSPFGHNGLYVVPMKGGQAGEAVQIVSAPAEAELTGIVVAPDRKSLFMSVQHPGGRSFEVGKYTSHWPNGGTSAPLSSVVELYGPTIDRLLSGGYAKGQV